MDYSKRKMLLVIITWLTVAQSYEVFTDKVWGEYCPLECDCEIVTESQPLTSLWKPENNSVKTVLCVFTNQSLFSILDLPNDTESISILQANNDSQFILTENIFEDLGNLKSIDMQGSVIGGKISIMNGVFYGLDVLEYLSLQRVDLTGAEKALSKLSTLEVLHVIHCDIGYLKWEMLDGLKNLKELYFVQSGIKELYGFAFYGTPELRRLFLSHNDLFSVEADAFVGLLKLEYLDLSNNRIDHLSGLTFPPLPHLQWLELKHNPIKVIFPHCFQFLNGTQHLTLGHEKQPVHLMKFSFRGLYSLLYLHIPNIDNDGLFEHMFYDLKSLIHMNLKGRIKLINNRAFNGANKVLNRLILHDCKIERLFVDSFFGLENLKLLDLSENLLQSLPDYAFNHMKSIEKILLNDNKLKQIPEMIFIPLNTLKAVTLYNNKWNCTCKMEHWKEDLALARYVSSVETCEGKNCTDGTIALKTDFSYVPKCENPEQYKDQNVFHVIKAIGCSLK